MGVEMRFGLKSSGLPINSDHEILPSAPGCCHDHAVRIVRDTVEDHAERR